MSQPNASCLECSFRKPGFLCSLSSPVLAALDEFSVHQKREPNAILFHQGTLAHGVFALCHGEAQLLAYSRDGLLLATEPCPPGTFLGLAASLASGTYEMTARTVSACAFNYISTRRWLQLMQRHPEMVMRVAVYLAENSARWERNLREVLLDSRCQERLIRLLLADPGPLTHQAMAERIASSRETVTRILCELETAGLIGRDKRQQPQAIILRDRARLAGRLG